MIKDDILYLSESDLIFLYYCRYISVLQGLLSGDYSKLSLNVFGGEFPGPVTKLFSTMLQVQFVYYNFSNF